MSAQVGSMAPNFHGQAITPDGNFANIKLSDYKGKWAVMFFYPEDFTFVCPTEIRGFNKQHHEFTAANAEVIGISTDSIHSHQAWIRSDLGKLKFPLLSDITKRISRDYGVLLEDKGIALRGTFIVDPEGKLRSATVNDTDVGRNVNETIRTLKALQTGELTPCDWSPGDNTLGKA